MQKILLDTDIGGDIDDAICLAYLLKEPQCDLLGITTVCGEPEKRAAVADAICRAAGRQVPIVAGLDTTLQPVPLYPTPEGAGALEQWPHSTYEKGDAPEFLYEKIRENPHQVVLIAIGNLTNVATLFTAHPDAVGLLKGLSVMNGYFGRERLPEPLYNWNSWADPMASKIVFASAPAFHRAVPLEVTDTLTIEAEQAEVLFPADSPLLQAVYAFGNAWLESSSKLTLHDPLAAVSVFHPDICQFERGFVQVETERESDMGGTAFTPSPQGTVEIARSVDRERFYRIVSATLRGEGSGESRRSLPEAVLRRAQSLGAVGEAWLANLESTIAALEGQWNVTVGQALSGGTHGFVAPADGKNGEAYVVKIELPDGLGGDFTRGVTALEKAGGQGYAKLYAYDAKRKSSAPLWKRPGPSPPAARGCCRGRNPSRGSGSTWRSGGNPWAIPVPRRCWSGPLAICGPGRPPWTLAALCWSTATPTAGTRCAPWQGTASSSLTRPGSGTRRPTTWGCSCGSGGRTTPRTRSKRARSGAPISTS